MSISPDVEPELIQHIRFFQPERAPELHSKYTKKCVLAFTWEEDDGGNWGEVEGICGVLIKLYGFEKCGHKLIPSDNSGNFVQSVVDDWININSAPQTLLTLIYVGHGSRFEGNLEWAAK